MNIATLICTTPDGIDGDVTTFNMDKENAKEILNRAFSKLLSEKLEESIDEFDEEEQEHDIEAIVKNAIENEYDYCGFNVCVQVFFSVLN